jgi:hypothetical protein
MCIEEALKDPDWLLAMQEELNNFTRNDVWVFDPPPQEQEYHWDQMSLPQQRR